MMVTRTCLLAAVGLVAFAAAGPLGRASEPTRTDRLIHQLGDDSFAKREEASEELRTISRPALPALRRATTNPDLEIRQRSQRLIEELDADVIALRKLGAQVDVDETSPDQAVIGVYLFWKPATDADLARLKNFAKLEILVIAGTKISDAGFAHLKGLGALTGLYATNTAVTDAGVAQIAGLTQLRCLDLSGTKLTDAGLKHLENMRGLRELHLSYTPITDAGLVRLKRFDDLLFLTLHNTGITDAGLEHLRGLKRLRILYLQATSVSDKGLEHLKGLRELRMLNVARTRVTPRGLADLSKVLPLLGTPP